MYYSNINIYTIITNFHSIKNYFFIKKNIFIPIFIFNWWRKIKFAKFTFPSINRALMTAIISIIITTSIMEMSVVQLSVFMGDLTSPLDVVIFSTLVAIYTTGQYVILLFIKRKINLHKIPKAKITHKIVSLLQYFSISLFIIIILQMIFASYYDIFLLILLIYTSYGLSVALSGVGI